LTPFQKCTSCYTCRTCTLQRQVL